MYAGPPPPEKQKRYIDGDRPSRLSLFWQSHKTGLGRTFFLITILGISAGGGWTLYNMLSDSQMEIIRTNLESLDPLKIKKITITGANLTDRATIMAQLNTDIGRNLFGFSVEKARLKLDKLPFIEHSTVERRLPDTIIITISERVPVAIWQTHNHFVLINQEGKPVSEQKFTTADTEIFRKLPLVVGDGANEHASALIDPLKHYPEIKTRTLALIRIGNRRWNMMMRNGTIILLPENAEEPALQRLNTYQKNFHLLERPLAAIDMRLPDRMVIHLPPEPTPAAPALTTTPSPFDGIPASPSPDSSLKKKMLPPPSPRPAEKHP